MLIKILILNGNVERNKFDKGNTICMVVHVDGAMHHFRNDEDYIDLPTFRKVFWLDKCWSKLKIALLHCLFYVYCAWSSFGKSCSYKLLFRLVFLSTCRTSVVLASWFHYFDYVGYTPPTRKLATKHRLPLFCWIFWQNGSLQPSNPNQIKSLQRVIKSCDIFVKSSNI